MPIEVLDYLAQRINHHFGRRTRQHFGKLSELSEQRFFEFLVIPRQAIAQVTHIGAQQLELARYGAFLIAS
ncbi:hypothetical protein D3C74_496920 [compost metagenome]